MSLFDLKRSWISPRMSTRFLFLDSTNRDRNLYPNPYEFSVPNGFKEASIYTDLVLDNSTPLQAGNTQAGSTTTVFVLAAAASTYDGTYVGNYIKITIGGTTYGLRITAYTGATRSATITPAVPVAPGAGVAYEIHTPRDSFSPLIYDGSQQTQTQCFWVELLEISIPNLNNITDEAFIFVEISSASNKNTRKIATNNPNIRDAVFIVPVDHTGTPFVHLKNSRMLQMIKFKTDDTLHFRVTLRDGTTVSLGVDDTSSPDAPTSDYQVGAYFVLRENPIASSQR